MSYASDVADQTFKRTADVAIDSTDPFSICKTYDYGVKRVTMPNSTMGLSVRTNRCATIFLSDNLTDSQKLLVLLHEVGHCRMHKNDSTPFMRSMMVGGWIPRIEREANEFAVRYMVDILKAQDIEITTTYGILQYFDLPESFNRFVLI